MVVPVDMEEGGHQHDISGIISLRLASCQNFGFSRFLEDQKKDCNIIFCTNNRPCFSNLFRGESRTVPASKMVYFVIMISGFYSPLQNISD